MIKYKHDFRYLPTLRKALMRFTAVLFIGGFILSSWHTPVVNAFAGGDGTLGSPYQIASWQDLNNVRSSLGAYYILTNNLDENSPGYDVYASSTSNSGSGWAPIGDNNTKFTGLFDGNNHTISNIVINRSGTNYVGVFGDLASSATVQNVTIEDATISGNSTVGGLTGYSDSNSTISRVHIISPTITSVSSSAGGISGKGGGNITLCSVQDGSVTSGAAWGGGITGWQTDGTISRSWTSTAVSALNDAGGIVGYGQNATISNSYALGNVSSPSASENSFGGVAGVGGSIINSYAAGNVTVAGIGYNTGGLFGEGGATIQNDFAVGTVTSTAPRGGFVGLNQTTITNSYSVFDTPVGSGSSSGVTDVADGSVFQGLSHSHAVFNNAGSEWDFTTIWEAHSDGYPTLLDNAPPLALAVSSFSPVNGASNVATDSTLSIVFNQPVVIGTGNILVKRSSDDTVAASVDITSGAVTGNNTDTIVLTLPAQLTHNVHYYVQIPATAFKDELNNAYAGINDTTSWNFTAIDDSDGISVAVEAAAPNGGDANDDGTADSEQSNVASFENTLTNNYISLGADTACSLSSVSSSDVSSDATDATYTYPLGLLSFNANCGTAGYTAHITQYYYDPPAGTFVLRKFVNDTYQTVNDATISTQTISGHQVLVVTYSVTDGGPLDADGVANGTIIDPVGLALANPVTPSDTIIPGAPNTGFAHRSLVLSILSVIGGLALISTLIIRKVYAIHQK